MNGFAALTMEASKIQNVAWMPSICPHHSGSRLGLLGVDGDGVSPAAVGPFVHFSDGSSGFYADLKAAWQWLRSLPKCTLEEFWEREWLDAPTYESLAEVWESLDTQQIEAADKPPRASDYVSIGRPRRVGPKEYLIQTENGEYGVVDEKQASKWRLTPLD
ncbi:hypothetical protein DFW101_1334 [Solidesulfovibrio carbinoliphilus subsp. oakridgensis]|uniref:Uncharacterized protein n=1 Tax=Solidesulfovibrio carbinoliphilus subsp. oakridgensis TaxID=694327 RepID=G7Q7N4_9BACT|nr:hypothetical protein [Solidesulfovibrio carbinoliphilus]EHJ47343.1 hypothetical protein DFW101_1334 [Solidesulfovibrio carbinoliphilus subsp. oakridgensis]